MFAGRYTYCAHDPDRAETSERVEWMDMRNIAANDPEQAWKVMAATAGAQNELKRAAGVRAGRASKDGAVMHVVLSFDQGEPTDRASMQAAADGFLSQLGADPAKMRGKAKPKRRQFADEHQVVMYAHRDTEHMHLHLMINTVHPEHGVKLPTSNNQLKAQKWALEHSKAHGTDQNYPARAENSEARAKGEYVKGERRKSRNIYEMEQALKEAGLSDARVKAVVDGERKKDATLAQRGRNLAKLQKGAWSDLIDGHRARKSSIYREAQRRTNAARAQVREEFRPKWRDLAAEQASERTTFAELEKTFFGRVTNVAATMRKAKTLIGSDSSLSISQMFRILTRAGDRERAFEAAQKRARDDLQRVRSSKLSEAMDSIKATQRAKLAQNRQVLQTQRGELIEKQKADRAQLKDAWKKRTVERKATMAAAAQEYHRRPKAEGGAHRADLADAYRSRLAERMRGSFDDAHGASRAKDRGRDRDDGQER